MTRLEVGVAKKTAAKRGKKTAGKAPKRKTERQQALIEDSVIEELEDLAHEYVDARDERMAIGEREVDLKTKLLAAMHKHGKSKYKRGAIEINVISEAETVKVRAKRDEVTADA